jgi:outer membrane receptor protein involved in Fe transport
MKKASESTLPVSPAFRPTVRPMALAVALAALQLGWAHAQTTATTPAAAAAADAADTLQLERIVVTGSTVLRTKMKQSVSVSNIDSDQIEKAVAASATELLRAVPGLRAESSGGEGNANLGVRGLPMSDGGGRYVQLQEDGLPLMLFGDISFATADQFMRADFSNRGVDVLRGGSSATLSTNASGATVNFLTKTGKQGGGNVGMSVGLDHRQQRTDFDYGAALGNKTYVQVGGFYRIGSGVRKTNITSENGGQVRLSLMKEFDAGYIRVTYKNLSDSTPTYLPVPVKLEGNTIKAYDGVDPRTAYFINSNFPQDTVTDRNGNRLNTNPADGLKVEVSSLGMEAEVKIGDGWSLSNKFRKTSIGGRFLGVFPAGGAPTDVANGANRYTGATPVFSAHIFNTSLDDMGNVFNDLRLQKTFDLGAGSKLSATGGLFTGKQKIAQTWYWNRYNIGLKGTNAALYNNAGAQTNVPAADGVFTWGGCCVRAFDYDITAAAPYAAVSWDAGPLSIDGSVRYDKQRGSGFYMEDVGTTGVWDRAGATRVSYSSSGTSASLGANYELDKNMAVFGRVSKGTSWKSPDRVLGDARVATGADPYPVNTVNQVEAGWKFRQAGLSAFVTAFFAKTAEGAGFELTSQTVKKNDYDSKGLEAELAYRTGGLRIAGGATLTKAEITSGGNKGKTPRRQADLVFQVSPSYSIGNFEVGGAIIGTTKSYAQDDNQVVLPAYAIVNTYANFEFAPGATVQLGVNNLLNTLAYTEAEGQGNLSNNPLYVARAMNGRSVKVSLKYAF